MFLGGRQSLLPHPVFSFLSDPWFLSRHMATWEEINYITFLVKQNDTVMGQREISGKVLWWFLRKRSRKRMHAFCPFKSSSILLSGILLWSSPWSMTKRVFIGMAEQWTGKSPQTSLWPPQVSTPFGWWRYNLFSCWSHKFSCLHYMQPDLIITGTLFYYRSVLTSHDSVAHLRIGLSILLFILPCLIIYSHHGILCQGFDVGIVPENNWSERFY